MNDIDQIYTQPDLYDQVSGNDGSDISFFLKEAMKLGGSTLELGCGTGRILSKIAELGIPCSGVDFAPAMLKKAEEKSRTMNLNVSYYLGDMRTFQLGQQFNLIFIAMNSLLHLHDRLSFEHLFSNVRKHLTEDGSFIVSIFNPSPQILSRNPSDRFLVDRYFDPKLKAEVTIEETTNYDLATQINSTRWYYSQPGQSDFYTNSYDLRVIFPQEAEALFHYNGFEVVSKLGNYQGKAFESGDQFQVFTAKVRE
jgi:SAM-dependent methyltransferase